MATAAGWSCFSGLVIARPPLRNHQRRRENESVYIPKLLMMMLCKHKVLRLSSDECVVREERKCAAGGAG